MFSVNIYSAVAMFFACCFSFFSSLESELNGNFGSIACLPAKAANLLKIDYDLSLNMLMSKLEPSRGLGPKPEQ